MPINPALLISAAVLQDYFVDKVTGFPLANGLVRLYHDNARNIFKPWYYQSGAPGAYTYIPLDNPMNLSSVGTIQDPNGNDVIPFFYPYSETDESIPDPYYITVYSVDENGQPATLQFTRENFPFLPQGNPQPTQEIPAFNNLVVNGAFYHNIGSLNATSVTNQIIAPGAHDGFYGANSTDIRFIKSVAGAVDTLTFTPFGLGNDPLVGDITPEYYLNFECSSIQAGETRKSIQIPLNLHIKTLENQNATVTIQAQNVAGSPNAQLNLQILEYFGSNALTAPTIINLETVTVSETWTKYTFNFLFPSGEGVTVGSTSDDAFYLNIGFPLSAIFNMNISLPSIFLSSEVPTNYFQTYDQIDRIINSPRLGDTRTSLNQFVPFGWVQMNDTTIGNTASNATGRANPDTWNLFTLLWSTVGSASAPMFTSAGTPVAYGASAIADWNANNQIQLPLQLGRALAAATSGQPFGSTAGSSTKTIAQNNLPANMTLGIGSNVFNPSAGGGPEISLTGGTVTNTAITNPGGGQPLNVVPPTTYYNIFMKL